MKNEMLPGQSVRGDANSEKSWSKVPAQASLLVK